MPALTLILGSVGFSSGALIIMLNRHMMVRNVSQATLSLKVAILGGFFIAAYFWFNVISLTLFPQITPFWHWLTTIFIPILPAAFCCTVDDFKPQTQG